MFLKFLLHLFALLGKAGYTVEISRQFAGVISLVPRVILGSSGLVANATTQWTISLALEM